MKILDDCTLHKVKHFAIVVAGADVKLLFLRTVVVGLGTVKHMACSGSRLQPPQQNQAHGSPTDLLTPAQQVLNRCFDY